MDTATQMSRNARKCLWMIGASCMKTQMGLLAATVAACLMAMSGLANAQDPEKDTSVASSPFEDGTYLSIMATGVLQTKKSSSLDDGYGATAALGYRSGFYGFEIAPTYFDAGIAKVYGGAVNGLLFPFSSLPNLYGTVGVGGLYYDDYESATETYQFNTLNADAGIGYLWKMSTGRYDFAIRTEARYRWGRRERDYNDRDIDFDADRRFHQAVLNIGLHLPFGKRAEAAPEPKPAQVVPAPTACSDGIDNDGDGVIDFGQDPGCSSAADLDETNAKCADGIDNDGDGLVDYPADKGCAAADDDDETDPCRTPEPGEKISLRGCGTGDVVVLRGVNFDFDQAKLTANAKTILDSVAAELIAYPDITVELGGHTDSLGSDAYNESLSSRRATAVARYLEGKGVAGQRLSAVGYGESQPITENETEEGREKNRRVELKITGGVAAAADTPPAAAADPSPVPMVTDPAAAAADADGTAPAP